MVPRFTCIDRSRTTVRPSNDLVRPSHVDRDVGRGASWRLAPAASSATLTGWPTRSRSGCSGRASIMNTSLERSSRL